LLTIFEQSRNVLMESVTHLTHRHSLIRL